MYSLTRICVANAEAVKANNAIMITIVYVTLPCMKSSVDSKKFVGCLTLIRKRMDVPVSSSQQMR